MARAPVLDVSTDVLRAAEGPVRSTVSSPDQIRSLLEGLQLQQDQELGDQTGAINQFFNDPQRLQEIRALTDPQFNQQLLGLQNQGREATRNLAFQNVSNRGGSVNAQQLGGIQQALSSQALGLSADRQQSQFGLQQGFAEQQQNFLQQALALNPFQTQGVNTLIGGFGGALEGSQIAGQDTQRVRDISAFGSDERSRALGNILNTFGNSFSTDRLSQAVGGRGFATGRPPNPGVVNRQGGR